MTETIDYAPLIPQTPPEGLVDWVKRQGKLNEEYLIYKAGRYYEPLTEQYRQAVEIRCTSCGETFYADKIPAGGCAQSYAPAPFGWMNPFHQYDDGDLQPKAVISGMKTNCPQCGAECKTVHVGAVNGTCQQHTWATVVHRIKAPGKRDRLALADWKVSRYVGKGGVSTWRTHLWTAFVVDERKIVRLMGYLRCMSTLAEIALTQRKTFLDDYGRKELLYPWDPAILEGTTAENCKLDRYLDAGGEYLVGYLALWRKRPAVENLVMQGCGKLVDDLIESEQKVNSYARNAGIPKLPAIDWKQKKPHLMLHMDREDFREFGRDLNLAGLEALSWAAQHGVTVKGRADLEALVAVEAWRYGAELLTYCGGDFWRTVRYLQKHGGEWTALRDYWRMAGELGVDLMDGQMRWPKDLRHAHDAMQARYTAHKNERLDKLIAARAEKLARYSWTADGILIRPAVSAGELQTEGNLLHHCVASYAKSVAAGSSAIYFVRRAEKPDEPWFTLELDEKKLTVRQNRGKYNCARTPEVKAFEEKWLRWVRAGARRTKKNDPANLPKPEKKKAAKAAA